MKNRHFLKCMSIILACSLLTLLCFNLVFAQSSDDFITITPENADQLELGYVLPGFCGIDEPNQNLAALWKVGVYDLLTGQLRFKIISDFGTFSPLGNYFVAMDDGVIDVHSGEQIFPTFGYITPDEKYFGTLSKGIYELETRKLIFPMKSRGYAISPDGTLIAFPQSGMYELKTGKRLLDLPNAPLYFSPNNKYFVLSGQGVYETVTGKQLITSAGNFPEFSPNSNYVSMLNDAVYDITSKQKLISLSADAKTTFSPDSKLIAISGAGVYELATLKRLFAIGSSVNRSRPTFLKNSPWLYVSNDGLYNLTTNQKLFSGSESLLSTSQDVSLVGINHKGIFDTTIGQLKFRIEDARFAAHDKLVLSILNTLDAPDSMVCAVYGIKGDKWPYRSGLVNTAHTQLYNAPDSEKTLDSKGNLLATNKQLAVFAQTPDKKWFRVSASSWVRASNVKPVSLPDGIPIENP